MIVITKNEKEALNERFPEVTVIRTMKQRSRRHRYYCEESSRVLRFLEALRAKSEWSTGSGHKPRKANGSEAGRKDGGRHSSR